MKNIQTIINDKLKEWATYEGSLFHMNVTLSKQVGLEEAERIFNHFSRKLDRKILGRNASSFPTDQRSKLIIVCHKKDNRSKFQLILKPNPESNFKFILQECKQIWHKVCSGNQFNKSWIAEDMEKSHLKGIKGILKNISDIETEFKIKEVNSTNNLEEIVNKLSELSPNDYLFTSDDLFNKSKDIKSS